MVGYVSHIVTKSLPRFGKITTENLMSYAPNLAFWGGAWAFGVAVYTENWPIFQDTFYKKIPVMGSYWKKEIPPEDRFY